MALGLKVQTRAEAGRMVMPCPVTRRGFTQNFLIIIAAVIILASSCAFTRPRGMVILKPSSLRPVTGDRPRIFLRFLPYSYGNYIVELDTPDGGGAYLEVGPALAATYTNALKAFFIVSSTSTKEVGQFAFIDLGLMEFKSELDRMESPGEMPGKVRLSFRLTQLVRIFSPDGSLLEDIPLEVSASSVVEYYDTKDFIAGAQDLAADMFLKLERKLLDHIVENNLEGKYRLRGRPEPVHLPDIMRP